MTPADRELAELLRRNPDLRVMGEPDKATAVLARDHAITQRTRELLALPHEDEMQAAVIAWADSQTHPALRWLFHVPNGGYRDAATAGKMKIAGQKPGVPDLLLPWTTFDVDNREIHGLVIEMKRKPNRPTREQDAWLEHFTTEGWRCEVCYSAEEAIGVLCEYLEITEER